MRYRLRATLLALTLFCSMTPSIGLAGIDEGVTAYKNKDYATALREIRPLATHGDAYAQNILGVIYAKGQGVPQDYKEAVKWYRLAADQGHADAQNSLGLRYDNGQEVPQDYKEAVKWFRLAADQGHPSGQNNLGRMYDNGQGVPQDYKEAVKWYRLAAEQGHAAAQVNLGGMYDNGQGVPQDHKVAVKWYRLAADQGAAAGQVNLGTMYANGQGVPQDYNEAVKWFRLAADQGHPSGQNNLGWMYQRGEGVPQDYKEAMKWYRLAADRGHTSSQVNLGTMYTNGQGVPQDYKEAMKWYRLAADRGDERAHSALGFMYENGFGVDKSSFIAYAIYNFSSSGDRDRLAKSMPVSEIQNAQNLAKEMAKPGNLLKALDAHSVVSAGARIPEMTSKPLPQSNPFELQGYSQGISELWILMLFTWIVAEVIAALRKKEMRKRLQLAALWSIGITSLATVGQMRSDQNALLQLAVCLAIYGIVACTFYLIRIKLYIIYGPKISAFMSSGNDLNYPERTIMSGNKLENWYINMTKGQRIFSYTVSSALVLFYGVGLIPLALLIYLQLGLQGKN